MKELIRQLTIPRTATIRDALQCIDIGGKAIALVLQEDGRLCNTLTDGDIRRAILAGSDTNSPVSNAIALKMTRGRGTAVTAPAGTDHASILQLMEANGIRQVPLVNDRGEVVELVTLDDVQTGLELPVAALIMAGGLGTRLRPLTDHVPKTMLPVGDKPLLEWIIRQLRAAGISRVYVATHHMPEKITKYFGDGGQFGVEITYLHESKPLGTAGALSLIDDEADTLFLLNGDILTRVNFEAMLFFHHEYAADMTVAVSQYDVCVPYGVVQCDGPLVQAITEKPVSNFLVSAGIYVIGPEARRLVPKNDRFDATDLIRTLLQMKRSVISFPILEYWLDIGRHGDYERAQVDVMAAGFSAGGGRSDI